MNMFRVSRLFNSREDYGMWMSLPDQINTWRFIYANEEPEYEVYHCRGHHRCQSVLFVEFLDNGMVRVTTIGHHNYYGLNNTQNE
uniref:Uncharacterized protein n=2 Tax=Meloidogyne TaxID=189290 RepID=A0A6V7WC39_MELEN|nr:unnamed protein product [Meloidogyne enterolobii]